MMTVAKRVVDVFYGRREGSEDYFVRVDLEPNPLDFDGVDQVVARVVRRDRTSSDRGRNWQPTYSERVVVESVGAFTVEAALADLCRKAGLS